MPKPITQFKGKNAVIGCGHKLFCNHSSSHPSESYYYIDMDKNAGPDYIFDINKNLPQELEKRFNITFLEHFPCLDYKYTKGFENLWNMTAEDGFIFILPSYRTQRSRENLKNLKYIEIYAPFCAAPVCVLIPKNQHSSIDKIHEQIQLNLDLKQLITRVLCGYPMVTPLIFFNTPHNGLSGSSTEIYTPEEQHNLTIHKQIPSVSKLYQLCNELEQSEIKKHASEWLWELNHFFKQDSHIIQRDITVFQGYFVAVIAFNYRRKLMDSNLDLLRIAANVFLALTIIGILAIAIHVYFTKQKYGLGLPLFYSAKSIDKKTFEIKNIVDQLTHATFPESTNAKSQLTEENNDNRPLSYVM